MNKSLTTVFVILILIFDDNLLSLIGYPHRDPQASEFFKVHPLGYLSIAIFLIFILAGKIGIPNLLQKCKIEFFLLLFCFLILAYLFVNDRFSSVSFIIDALATPAVVAILFSYTDPQNLYSQKKLIYLLFFLNFLMAVYEKVSHTPILTDAYLRFDDFRSTALYGHPLNNALIMSTMGIILYISFHRAVDRVTVLLIVIISLLCFGARGSLIGIAGGLIIVFLKGLFSKGIKDNFKSLAIVLFMAFVGYFLIANTSLGKRIRDRGSLEQDESSLERVKTLQLLARMDSNSFQWGMSDRETDILTANGGVTTMENFFVVWITKFGFYISVILIIILLLFLRKQIKEFNKTAVFPVLFTVLFVASTNNSLASKTRVFSVLVLYCFVFKNTTSSELALEKNELLVQSS